MGILTQLFEKRSHTPDDPLSSGWFVRMLGGGGMSDAGITINEHTALNSLLAVSCVRILAETVATLPFPVYRRMEPRGRDRARDHALYPILHDEPNPYMSSVTYWERVMAHLGFWGNSYSRIEETRGDVSALWPIHPREVEPFLTKQGELRYRLHGNESDILPASEVLHIPGLGMDGHKGLSPLSMMRQALGIAVAAESYGARFFANDARPSVLLKHPAQLSETARANLRDSWQEMHGGANRGGVGILEEGMDFATVGMPPQDAQFLETRRFQVQEFARFYRIPPHLLADVERSTSWGSGIEQQNIGFVVYTMRPWLVRIEKEVNRKLIPAQERRRYYAEFLVDGLLRGDLAARKDYYATARQWGWMSANDILELENQNPIENGDIYLQPMNMVEAGEEPESEPERQETERPPLMLVDEQEAAGTRTQAEQRIRDVTAEQRSITARRRLANRHVAMYRDVLARLIRIEKQEVSKEAKRKSAADFEQWVKDYYYDRFPARVEENMQPPVRTLMGLIADEIADELDGDVPDDEIDTFATEYVTTLAKRHCGDSRSRLLALLHEQEGRSVRQEETLADIVDEELEEWDDRVDIDAEDEAHRSSNAAAVVAYGLLGVLALRWIATGTNPCDYCKGMDGRTVSTGNPFLGAGEEFAPGGVAAFISQSSISHPPIHSGCQCVIAPG